MSQGILNMFQALKYKIMYHNVYLMLLLKIFIIAPILTQSFSMKYTDNSGFDIPDIFKYNKFNIMIKNNGDFLNMTARNHSYNTNINMIKNPCQYYLYTKKKTNFIIDLGNSGFKIDKYNYTNAPSGIFNVCKRMMLFNQNNANYYIKYLDNKYLINKETNGKKILDVIKETENETVNFEEIYGLKAIQTNNKNPKETKKQKERKISESENKTNNNKYRLKLVVFNDNIRTKYYSETILKETEAILEIVKEIYRESKADIKIKVTEIMNLKDKIENDGDLLGAFRRHIEPMRYDPKNLGSAVSEADFIILLKERDNEVEQDLYQSGELARMYREHGASYFGGANGLNKSYSVVYTRSGESRYFTGKKIAHEIGHGLGVHHDKIKGYLMETSTCATCENEKRVFSSESLKEMNEFVKENSDVFEDSEMKTIKVPAVVKTRDEAIKYVKSKRRHSYNEILNGVLDGVAPENSEMNYYLVISIIFYIGSIFIAMLYLK